MAYPQIASVVQEDKTEIRSVSNKGEIFASNAKIYMSDSTALMKKANSFSNTLVNIIYYLREGKNYFVDVKKVDKEDAGMELMSKRKVFEKQSNK
jgi:hypothetical protein